MAEVDGQSLDYGIQESMDLKEAKRMQAKRAHQALESLETVTLLFIGALLFAPSGLADDAYFGRVEFGQGISVELPKGWVYLDEGHARQIDQGAEAMIRLSTGITNTTENVVLAAANAYVGSNRPVATLRLSVRNAASLTQEETGEIARLPPEEMKAVVAEIAEVTRRGLMSTGTVKDARITSTGVSSNKSITCMIFEVEVDAADAEKDFVTFWCPLGSRSLKLSGSYLRGEKLTYRPTIEYVWRSLRVK